MIFIFYCISLNKNSLLFLFKEDILICDLGPVIMRFDHCSHSTSVIIIVVVIALVKGTVQALCPL